MKKEDLRVGNRYQWNKFACMGNGEFDMSIGAMSYAEFIDPIPLTPLLLNKCNISLLWNIYYEDGIIYVSINDCELELPYLHELQDLHKALTGKELKWKH